MTSAKKLRYSVTESQQTAAWESGAELPYDELPPTGQDEADASVCPHCGEPLPWHEPQACQPTRPAAGEETPDPVAAAAARSAGGFAFALGSRVLPSTQQQAHPVVWRGQLKERHPATGLVQRVPVYRLGDGYWDCYQEDELCAA